MTAELLERLFSLRGRRAVITGGSSGIGRAIGETLAAAGAEVILIARRRAPLEEAVASICRAGGSASYLTCDLADRSALHSAADQLLEQHGAPDILVNAAGVNLRPHLDNLNEEVWDRTLATNLTAPFLLGQKFGSLMAAAGWGRIIHISSQQSIRAFGNSGAYGVSKAGLGGLARSQAEAWSARGVSVNAVAPGFVGTPLTADVYDDPDRVAAMAQRTMVGRNGMVDDFAPWLCSWPAKERHT